MHGDGPSPSVTICADSAAANGLGVHPDEWWYTWGNGSLAHDVTGAAHFSCAANDIVIRITDSPARMLSTTRDAGTGAICLLRSMAMTAATSEIADPSNDEPVLTVGPPTVEDGVAMWRLAGETGVLDVNSRYSYLIWCRDFAATSVVAKLDGEVVGFITGYRRPDAPNVLLVWQVAVGAAARGRGVAGTMLDRVFAQAPGVAFMETTVTPDNEASIAMFTAFARRNSTEIHRSDLFSADLLGDGHEPENLYRIGPIPSEGI